MPLPAAHAAAGVSIVLLAMGPVTRRALPWLVAGGALAGTLPDMAVWMPEMVQRGSHSLFLAVTLWSFAVLLGQRWSTRLPEVLAMALISHIVLDFLFTQYGKGAALLWPIPRPVIAWAGWDCRRISPGITGPTTGTGSVWSCCCLCCRPSGW